MSAIHAMQVTIGPGCWTPTFRATCSDPAADCHYVCAEGCESWGPIVRNEAGAVIGHRYEEYGAEPSMHYMEHVEECNYIGFLNESDDATEDMTGEPVTFTIPAVFTYEDEEVTWEAES